MAFVFCCFFPFSRTRQWQCTQGNIGSDKNRQRHLSIGPDKRSKRKEEEVLYLVERIMGDDFDFFGADAWGEEVSF